MDTYNHYTPREKFETNSENIKTVLSEANRFLKFEEVILYPIEHKLKKNFIAKFDPTDLEHVRLIAKTINKVELMCAGPALIQDCYDKIDAEGKIQKEIETSDLLLSDKIILLEYCIKYCKNKKEEYDPTGSIKFNKDVAIFVYLNGKKEPSVGKSYHDVLKEGGGWEEIVFNMKLRSDFWNKLTESFKSTLSIYTNLYQKQRLLPGISTEIPPRLIVELIEIFRMKKFSNDFSLGIIEQELLNRFGINKTRYSDTKSKYNREVKNKFKVLESILSEFSAK